MLRKKSKILTKPKFKLSLNQKKYNKNQFKNLKSFKQELYKKIENLKSIKNN